MARGSFKRFAEIALADLMVGRSNSRTENVEVILDDLVEHIYVNGLLEPITVFAIDDLTGEHELYESRKRQAGKYEILAGQRRYNAFLELNRQHPGDGFDKMPCNIRIPPTDEADAKAISVGENLTHLPMTLADTVDACDFLFHKYNDEKIVAKKHGISVGLVRKYVKFKRLPKILQDNLDKLHGKPKTAMNIAVDAMDAVGHMPDGSASPEQRVYDFAMMLARKKAKSGDEYKKLRVAGHKNREKTLEEIEAEASAVRNATKYTVLLEAEYADSLEAAAVGEGKEPEEEAHDIIVDGLKTRVSATGGE